MRPGTTPEALAKLPPYFKKDGAVTAGNASGICDGAAALMLCSERFASEQGLRPLGRLVAWAATGVDPRIMGIGPAPASRRALELAGLRLDDMDLVEVNEAFASVVLSWARIHEPDMDKVNANGGAIALGHPVGATGSRLITTALHELERADKTTALVSMCCGGALATGTILERI